MIFATPVDVRFRSRDLHRICNQHALLKARWGSRAASALTQTLHELEALECLGDMQALPYVRMRRDDDGLVQLDSVAGVRLRMIAQPITHSTARSWKASESVVIVEIEIVAEEDHG